MKNLILIITGFIIGVIITILLCINTTEITEITEIEKSNNGMLIHYVILNNEFTYYYEEWRACE